MCPLRAKLLCPADREFCLGHKDSYGLSRLACQAHFGSWCYDAEVNHSAFAIPSRLTKWHIHKHEIASELFRRISCRHFWDRWCWCRLNVCLFCQILEPKFECLVLLVVDAVHPASSQVYITRIQQCTTVSSSALWHIGTVFSSVIALRLSEKLFSEIRDTQGPRSKL